MKNIQDWVNDKPVLLALTSLEWIYWAPDIYDYLRAFGEKEGKRKLKQKFPLPPFDEWIDVYENASVIASVTGILMSMNDLFAKVANLFERDHTSSKDPFVTEIKKQGLSTPNEIKSHAENDKNTQDNYWLQISKMRLDSMKGEISGVDDAGIERIRGSLTSPIIVFAVRVLAPSLLLYQRNPQDLFKEAKSGKFDSLAKLLVIDKEILSDRDKEISHDLPLSISDSDAG